jgi:hypothetical protein
MQFAIYEHTQVRDLCHIGKYKFTRLNKHSDAIYYYCVL